MQSEVKAGRLDDLAGSLQRLDFIKIDAEGGEMLILHGAVETIRRRAPVVSVEYGKLSYAVYGNEAETLYLFARKHSYVICDLFGAAIRTRDAWLSVCDHAYWDWYPVPERRLKRWRNVMRPMGDVEAVARGVAAAG